MIVLSVLKWMAIISWSVSIIFLGCILIKYYTNPNNIAEYRRSKFRIIQGGKN